MEYTSLARLMFQLSRASSSLAVGTDVVVVEPRTVNSAKVRDTISLDTSYWEVTLLTFYRNVAVVAGSRIFFHRVFRNSWSTKRRHVQQISVAKMRMLHWICGHTRRDRVRNDDIRDRLGVAPVEEKLVQHRLRWFGHVQHRPQEASVRSGIQS